MKYAVINNAGVVVAKCDVLPDEQDLSERGESVIKDVDGGAAKIGDTFTDNEFVTPPPTLDEAKAAKRAAIETARKAAEHEGVTVEGIRYAGDPSNRQALSEALDLAAITDQTHFSSWKDSDGQFHTAHPVADVHAALLAIGQRRGELIDREGVLSEQISAANDVATVEAIQW